MRRPELRMSSGFRNSLILFISVLVSIFLLFRGIPRILPWDGKQALETTVWSAEISDREGRILQIRPVDDEGLRRVFVPLVDLPPEAGRIICLSEDRRFYVHPGFDLFSLLRAGSQYVRGAGSSGGSTITMQLARILNPRPDGVEVTVPMKLGEIWDALQIESRYSKKEILELYINLVPFGRNIEGYPAAAKLYFGKDLSLLNPGELCVLTVIPRSPAAYDPILSPEANREAAERLVAAAPRRFGQIRLPHELPTRTWPWPFFAPHFVERITTDRQNWSENQLRGTVPVRTTLNLSLQEEARALLEFHVDLAADFRISNGAMLLADPKTMEVLVYLGSADFYDEEASGQIDGVAMRREPGSTLKPLLYASALDSGWTASTILPDIPMEFGNEYIYTPMNYDQQYHGPVRLRQALAASLNIPAVYTLERLGMDRFLDSLISAGFTSLEDQRHYLGVGLAIGGGEVSLGELVQGYGALYSGGISRNLRMTGNEPEAGDRIWSLESADIITDIISNPDDRVMTFGRTGPVRFDYPAAIKTGTSNQFNNIWAVGFTSDLIGAVWMGNFDGSTVIAAPGSSLPAKVLHESFDRWSEKGDIHRHSELEKRRICSISGMEATEACPYSMAEYFSWGTAPASCDWHSRSSDGSVSVHYPQEYLHWADRYGYSLTFSDNLSPGITYPVEGSVYYSDPSAPGGAGDIRISLVGSGYGRLSANNETVYEGPLPANIHWAMQPGRISLVLDSNGGRIVRRIEVR